MKREDVDKNLVHVWNYYVSRLRRPSTQLGSTVVCGLPNQLDLVYHLTIIN